MNDSVAVWLCFCMAVADPNDSGVAGPGQPPYLRYQANYKVPQHRAGVLGPGRGELPPG